MQWWMHSSAHAQPCEKAGGRERGQERARARGQDCRDSLIPLTHTALTLLTHTRKDSGFYQRLNERTAEESVWSAGGVREQ